MGRFTRILLFLAITTTALTSASPGVPPSLRTAIPHPPAPWQESPESLSPAAPLHLRIALSLQETTLQSLAWSVSDPSHLSYGAHLSQSAMAAILSPSATSVEHVRFWLESSGAENISISSDGGSGGSWVDFDTTVGLANELLSASFERFEYVPEIERRDLSIIRSLAYTVPAEIAELIDFIHPVTHFPRIEPRKQKKQLLPGTSASFPDPQPLQSRTRTTATRPLSPRASIPNSCVSSMTPACLTTLYNINYAAPANDTSPSRIGVAGFLFQYPNHGFVNTFLENYGVPLNRTPIDFTVEWINFSNPSLIPNIDNSTTGAPEAILDVEYSMAFTNPISVTYYYTNGTAPFLDQSGALQFSESDNEPYLELLEYYLSLEDPPQVLSFSYTDTEQTVPYAYARRVCNLFAALAARGVSVVVAAGDSGVEGAVETPNDVCLSNDGKNTTQFLPTFPASCPYVTAVGATNLYPEIAASYTAGGFSNYFEVPDWQVNTTSSYISSLNGTYDGLYNKSGRGIPDISAVGDRFLVTFAGGVPSGPRGLSGTSASTPVIAGMVALLNDERMRKGKSSLGWLNPLLYSQNLTQAWQDVIEGNNYGCGTPGFSAGPGWDAVTGLGTPKFDVLRDLVV